MAVVTGIERFPQDFKKAVTEPRMTQNGNPHD